MFCPHNSLRLFLTRRCGSTISKGKEAIYRVQYSSKKTIPLIAVGSKLPDAELYENFPANKVNIKDFTKGKRVVLFSACGAFTPICSKSHLPGYVTNAQKIKKEGIDEIMCISVNDPYVMAAWGAEHSTKGKVRMLADPSGDFVKAIGLAMNVPQLGGLRAKRFSMIVNDSRVEKLNVEPDGIGLSCSGANNIDAKEKEKK